MASKGKGDTLTPRQRQSQKIMREKSTRKKRQALVRKLQIAIGAAAAIALVGGSAWMWQNSLISKSVASVVDGAYGLTVKAGFALESLYLDGRNRTSMKDIEEALGVKKGDPILRMALDEMRERLEKIESVRMASVERELPRTLYVHIVEREPVALWQNQGKVALVDDNGVVMKGIDTSSYRKLPLIVGEEAPKHVNELLAILSSDEEMAKRFTAAVFVGGRRWNIRLNNGIEVRLPEQNPVQAWKTLAGLQASEQLLDRDVKVIDLRVEDRLFIKVPPEGMPGGKTPTNAKET